jgi:hypothetical protein
MFIRNEVSLTPRSVVIALFLLGGGLLYSWSSFGDSCGAYCKARQVRDFCHEIVKSKDLTGDQRDVEFEKCKVDPMNQIKELVDDTGESLE